MKKVKLLTVILAVCCVANLIFAVDPIKVSVDDIANNMVGCIHEVVKLSTDQKAAVKVKSLEYAQKLEEARAMDNKDESYRFMKGVTEEYELALDSILTADQRMQKEKKNTEIINALILKQKSNK